MKMKMTERVLPDTEDFSSQDKVLYAAAMLFFEQGYAKTTVVKIADRANVNRGSVIFAIKSKENLLYTLLSFVLNSLFVHEQDETEVKDPVLSYAVEMALQLYMVETREQLREMAITAYGLPTTSELIYRLTGTRLMELLSSYNPQWEEKDFYERAIASGSVMRGYMARPCDMYFTIERKARLFLETTLPIYNVPKEKINEAATFLSSLDLTKLAESAIKSMLDNLEKQMYSNK